MAEPGSTSRISPLRALELLALVALIGLAVQGLRTQLYIGQANLDPNSAMNRVPADAKAGVWIRSHTDTNAVIMARQVPTVCHYSKRRVIWFPPSSDPQLLMEGTLKHRVNFVIVVRREDSYYLPPDEDCFAGLLNAYPSAFRLAYETPEFRVFEVMRDLPRPAASL
jgi:hypothetical protein